MLTPRTTTALCLLVVGTVVCQRNRKFGLLGGRKGHPLHIRSPYTVHAGRLLSLGCLLTMKAVAAHNDLKVLVYPWMLGDGVNWSFDAPKQVGTTQELVLESRCLDVVGNWDCCVLPQYNNTPSLSLDESDVMETALVRRIGLSAKAQ